MHTGRLVPSFDEDSDGELYVIAGGDIMLLASDHPPTGISVPALGRGVLLLALALLVLGIRQLGSGKSPRRQGGAKTPREGE